MRYILGLFVVVLLALYFTIGLRVGYLTLSPMFLLNASGTNTYTLRTLEDPQQVGVKGQCTVNSGSAVLTITDPAGNQRGAQACSQKGTFGLELMAGGKAGIYTVKVELKNYTGSLEINEQRAGAR